MNLLYENHENDVIFKETTQEQLKKRQQRNQVRGVGELSEGAYRPL